MSVTEPAGFSRTFSCSMLRRSSSIAASETDMPEAADPSRHEIGSAHLLVTRLSTGLPMWSFRCACPVWAVKYSRSFTLASGLPSIEGI
jgi:hypothetical protein